MRKREARQGTGGADKGSASEWVPAVGLWGSVPWGPAKGLCGTRLRIMPPRG